MLRKPSISLSCIEFLLDWEDNDNDVLFQTYMEENERDISYSRNEISAFVVDEFEFSYEATFSHNPGVKKRILYDYKYIFVLLSF